MKIACLLFAYNRPKYLRKAIKTHKKIDGLDYYAFIDMSDKKEVIDIIHGSGIYNVIINRQEHYGLNRNIKEGIDWVLQDHDAVIVLEDDLLLSEDALEYLKSNLEHLIHPNIYAVSCQKGEGLDRRFKCWAWGTWKDRWEKINWELKPKEKNRDSWDVIVNENFKTNNWFCYCSEKPRVKHIGWSGVHYSQLDRFSIRRLYGLILAYFKTNS